MTYPLIKKWLGLITFEISDYHSKFILADDLEAKLAEGFELIQCDYCSDNEWTTHEEILGGKNGRENIATHKCLAIGKQPIKKQTQADAIKDLLNDIGMFSKEKTFGVEYLTKRLRKILEMKDE